MIGDHLGGLGHGDGQKAAAAGALGFVARAGKFAQLADHLRRQAAGRMVEAEVAAEVAGVVIEGGVFFRLHRQPLDEALQELDRVLALGWSGTPKARYCVRMVEAQAGQCTTTRA